MVSDRVLVTKEQLQGELADVLKLSSESLEDHAILQLRVLGGPIKFKGAYSISMRLDKLRVVLKEIAASEVAQAEKLPAAVVDKHGIRIAIDWSRTARVLFALDRDHHPGAGGLMLRQNAIAEQFGLRGRHLGQRWQRRHRKELLKVMAAALLQREEQAVADEDAAGAESVAVTGAEPEAEGKEHAPQSEDARADKVEDPPLDPDPSELDPATHSDDVRAEEVEDPPLAPSPSEPEGPRFDEPQREVATDVPASPPLTARFSPRRLLVVTMLAGVVGLALVLATPGPDGTHNSPKQPPRSPTTVPPTTRSTDSPSPLPPVRTPTRKPTPQAVGLAQVAQAHDLSWGGNEPRPYENDGGQTVGTGTKVGTVSIGGHEWDNSVSGRLWNDDSGFSRAVIATRGRYREITGVVGIDDNTPCPQNTGRVDIENESGHRLWSRRLVRVGEAVRFHVRLQGAVQVALANELTRSAASSADQCAEGDTDFAWGDVNLLPTR